MKKKNIFCLLRTLLFMSFLMLTFYSCTTNASTIRELASMQEELEEYYDVYQDDEWEDFLYRYSDLKERMSKRDYSMEGRKEIRRIQGRITATLTKRSVRGLFDFFENLPELINGIVEETDGFLEGFQEEINCMAE